MRKFAEALYFIALTAWVGGLWVVGYVVAPTLFSSLGDRQLAGLVAGKLFAFMGWIGFASGACQLLILTAWRCRMAIGLLPFLLILIMLAITAALQLGVQPLMAQLKAEVWPRDVMDTALRDQFGLWHAIGSILYLIQSGLGLWLVVWSSRRLK